MQPTDIAGGDNRSRIVEALWHSPGLSRVELAGQLKLDKSTLSRGTGRLIETGMVEEVSQMESGPRGGRRPVGLAVRGDWGLWSGLELQPDGYNGVLVDFTGMVRRRFRADRHIDAGNLRDVLEGAGIRARNQASELNLNIVGAGLSVPGPVRPGLGTVERSRPLGIHAPLDLAGLNREVTGLVTWVGKDVNCGCVAENRFTTEVPHAMLNCLYLLAESRLDGLALGLGLMIDGRLNRGDHGAGGELFSVYRDDGYEQLAMNRDSLARAGSDPDVLDGVVKELAPQIAFIANALDIDRLILGGLFERDFGRIGPAFRQELVRRRTYPDLASPDIVSARRGEDAVAYGAAVHFTENLASQHFWREI